MKQKQNFIDKYYLHSFAIGILAFLFYVLSINNSFLYTSIFNYSNLKSDVFDWTVSPIKYTLNYLTVKQIDRKKRFTDLDSSLFISMPDYEPNILSRDITTLKAWNKEYEETMLQRTVYITPYMWNYNHDWKENVWSHLAIDIKAPIWTPVYAIANWVVTRLWYEKWWFGNYVIIRHDNVKLSDWSIWTIYSNYAHLDTITIKEWVKISRGDPIATVWETGLAVGSHLHFQIDLANAPSHPYWPFTWADQRAAWLDFFAAVSSWLGRENAMKYTINPMMFIKININNSNPISVSDVNIPKENNPEETSLIKTEKDVAVLDNAIAILDTKEEPKKDEEINTIIESDLKVEDITTVSKFEIDANIDLIKNADLSYVNTPSIDLPKTDENTSIFPDVDNQSKYYSAINYYKNKGLISWYEDNNFYPSNDISRIESLKILLNSYSYLPIKWNPSKYIDINDNFWWNWYISKALDINLLDTANTNFYPNRTINRVEVLKLITKLSEIDLTTYASKNYEIKDVLKTEWEYPYVVFALDNNLFSLDNWNFYTSQTVSRWELVDLMYKFKK